MIESLSGQSEPNKLQDVAKKLLNLQKLINMSINGGQSNQHTNSNVGRNSEKLSFKNISNMVNNISTTPTLESIENKSNVLTEKPAYGQNSSRNGTTVSNSPFR